MLDGGINSAAVVSPLSADEITGLRRLLRGSGLNADPDGRTMLIFAYPGIGVGEVYSDLSGCTGQICELRDRAHDLEHLGIRVIGLSTEGEDKRSKLGPIPFEIGRISHQAGARLSFTTRDGNQYALRTTFIVHPDGSALRFDDITDSRAHIQECIALIRSRQLSRAAD